MSEKRWICATCSEGFTRSYSADRHIRNLHSGLAKKVRVIDYIVGRISGEFSPADSSFYRHANEQHGLSRSHVLSHEKNADRFQWQPITDTRKDVNQPSPHYEMHRSREVPVLGAERGKRDPCRIPAVSPRLEEVKKHLMSFSDPGEEPPIFVERTLAHLSNRIMENGGKDSFLEGPLNEVRDYAKLTEAAGLSRDMENEAEPRKLLSEIIREDHQVSNPSAANLPMDAIDKLRQIEDQLKPFRSSEYIHNKINELVTRYNQTGDPSIFGGALVNCLNNLS